MASLLVLRFQPIDALVWPNRQHYKLHSNCGRHMCSLHIMNLLSNDRLHGAYSVPAILIVRTS